MSDMPNCVKCECENTYELDGLMICPECGYEWNAAALETDEVVVRDANGNVLADGDTVVLVKDLKVKGASGALKQGTVVKNIVLADEAGHNISCKVPGFGSMFLKSEFVKKN